MRDTIGKTLVAVAMLTLLAPAIAGDMPTTDQLLEKYAAAHGGAKRWAKVESMKWTGSETTFSEIKPFTLVQKRPHRLRMDRTVMKRTVVIGYDGETVWWNNPLMGADWAVEMPLPEAAVTRGDADLGGPLMNAKANGYQVKLVGLGDVDGTPAYEVKLTRADGTEETWYIDPESYLEIARVSPGADFGRSMEKWTYFSDFRNVDGLVLPHRIESEFGNRNEVLALEKVRINPDIDDDIFHLPRSAEMEPLASLAGEWDLKVEIRPYPQAPWREVQTTSTIASRLDGRLLEEQFDYEDQGVRNEIVRSWSYDRFQKLYRMTEIDNFTAHQNVLEGAFEEEKLALSNEKSGTTWSTAEGTYHQRCTLLEIAPDSFRIDSDISNDGGENWFNNIKYTYTRK